MKKFVILISILLLFSSLIYSYPQYVLEGSTGIYLSNENPVYGITSAEIYGKLENNGGLRTPPFYVKLQIFKPNNYSIPDKIIYDTIALNPNEKKIITFTNNYFFDKQGNYKLVMDADINDVAPEFNETDNHFEKIIYCDTPYPDVATNNIWFEDKFGNKVNEINELQYVYVKGYITNIGDTIAPVSLHSFIRPDGIDIQKTEPKLVVGENFKVGNYIFNDDTCFRFLATGKWTTNTVRVIANSHSFPEKNRSNNEAVKEIYVWPNQADLVAENLSFSNSTQWIHQDLGVTVKIRNIGGMSAGTFDVRYSVQGMGCAKEETTTINFLAGKNVFTEQSITFSGALFDTEGWYNISVYVDTPNKVSELDDTINNQISGRIYYKKPINYVDLSTYSEYIYFAAEHVSAECREDSAEYRVPSGDSAEYRVQSAEFWPHPDDSLYITVRADNAGPGGAETVPVELYSNEGWGMRNGGAQKSEHIGSVNIPFVLSGKYNYGYVKINAPETDGCYIVTAKIPMSGTAWTDASDAHILLTTPLFADREKSVLISFLKFQI